MKKQGKPRRVDPQRLDSFTAMAHRAGRSKKIGKGLFDAVDKDGPLSMAELAYIRKIATAHKGARTLFTRQCRPEASYLLGVFNFMREEKNVEAMSALSQASGGSAARAREADEHFCFAPLHAIERGSLHDSSLKEWRMEPGLLSVVFHGYFSSGGDDSRYMEARFSNPSVSLLLRGIPARLSKEAARGSLVAANGYDKNNNPFPEHQQRPFASYNSHGRACSQGFDQLLWIHDEERSLQSEPLSWKILFGSNNGRGLELAIGFDSLEFTFGKAAIEARRDAMALAKELDGAAQPAGRAPKAAKSRI